MFNYIHTLSKSSWGKFGTGRLTRIGSALSEGQILSQAMPLLRRLLLAHSLDRIAPKFLSALLDCI
jgi:hypothetical protein